MQQELINKYKEGQVSTLSENERKVSSENKLKKDDTILLILKICIVLIWAAIVIFCFIHRNDISLAEILSFEPKNKLMAAFILIAMFGIKSLSIVIYNGILYAAAGIMFPLPVAVLVNIIGTAVMVSLPYVIGRFIGTSAVERIVSKYPKAQQVKELRAENDFMFTFLTRVVGGFLPCDIVSMYMGAIAVSYRKYLPGCILGMLPTTILLPIIGMNIKDPKSPAFIIAIIVQLMWMGASVVIYRIYKKKKNRR